MFRTYLASKYNQISLKNRTRSIFFNRVSNLRNYYLVIYIMLNRSQYSQENFANYFLYESPYSKRLLPILSKLHVLTIIQIIRINF